MARARQDRVQGRGRDTGGEYVERRWHPNPQALGGRRARRSYTYRAYVPRSVADVDVVLPASTAEVVFAAERACRELNDGPPALVGLEALARQLLRAEAVASSRIEGLVLSHRRLARAFLSTDARDQSAVSVVANVRATERAIELAAAAAEISIATLVEIHTVLFTGTRDDRLAGVIREEQNWIGGRSDGPEDAEFVPPPYELVPDALEDLCRFVNREDVPAVIQAAIAHAQFETIHPFLDGNGRVGRAFIHVVLRRREVTPRYVPPVSLVLAGRADNYIKGLTDYRSGSEEAWWLTFAEALERAALGARDFAGRVAELQERWFEQAGRPRPQSAARRLIAALPAYPVVDLRTAQEITGLRREASRKALLRLQQADVLREFTLGRRNRAWETVGLFDLLDSFERELGPQGRVPRPTR